MNVLLIILGALLMIGVVICVAPFRIRIFFSNKDGKTSYTLRVTWLIAAIEHNSQRETPEVKVLWFSVGKKPPADKPEETTEPGETVKADVAGRLVDKLESEPVLTAPPPVVVKSTPVAGEVPLQKRAPVESPPPKADSAPPGRDRMREKKPGPVERLRKLSATVRSGWKRLNDHIAVAFLRDSRWRGKVLHWLKRFMGGMLRTARINRIALDVVFGGEEPDEVGRNWGYVMSAYHALSTGKRRRITLNLKPVFAPHPIEGSVRAVFSTSIMQLTAPAVIALFTFPYVSTLMVYLRHRKKKRNQAAAGG